MYHINSTEYERSFWDAMKRKNPTYNGLSQGRHSVYGTQANAPRNPGRVSCPLPAPHLSFSTNFPKGGPPYTNEQ